MFFSHAVEATKTGIPVMRAMFLEFDGDRAVDYLDKQYMIGDSLLVAPIFKKSGEVSYYLPKGVWYNILTEKEYLGNTWITEKYDYFSMPLLVRENSILLEGHDETRCDYDYEKDLRVYFSHFNDGKTAIRNVYDKTGNLVCLICANCVGSDIYIELKGSLINPSFISLCNQNIILKK
jgi:alpha-D-xyloside xylohydrolase